MKSGRGGSFQKIFFKTTVKRLESMRMEAVDCRKKINNRVKIEANSKISELNNDDVVGHSKSFLTVRRTPYKFNK